MNLLINTPERINIHKVRSSVSWFGDGFNVPVGSSSWRPHSSRGVLKETPLRHYKISPEKRQNSFAYCDLH